MNSNSVWLSHQPSTSSPASWTSAATIALHAFGSIALGFAQVNTAPALAVPLMVLGLGHGILVPPMLAGTVGLVPALAGSAAAVAGLMQQMMGALSGYVVGLVEHEGAVNLGLVMLAFAGTGAIALTLLLARQGRGRRGALPR